MKIKFVSVENRVDNKDNIIIDLGFTLADSKEVHKGCFKFSKNNFEILSANLGSNFNEEQTAEVVKKFKRNCGKDIILPIVREDINKKVNAVITEAIVTMKMTKECNQATVNFKIENENTDFAMNFINGVLSENAVVFMTAPLYKYADSIEDTKEIVDQVLHILKANNKSLIEE